MTRGFEYVGMSCKKSGGLLLCNDRSGAETSGSFSAHTATHSTSENAHEAQSISHKLLETKKTNHQPPPFYDMIKTTKSIK